MHFHHYDITPEEMLGVIAIGLIVIIAVLSGVALAIRHFRKRNEL